MDNIIYLHADRVNDNEWQASEIIDGELQNRLWNFEYNDVVMGEYQIWEYPSGIIYKVVSDREIEGKNNYSTPNPELWLPELVQVGTDQNKVLESYNRLK